MFRLSSFFLLIFSLFIVGSSRTEAQETAEDAPAFSFWRNLPQMVSAYQEFGETLVPMDDVSARDCCAVKPGQKITLVRAGLPLGVGFVSDIFAAKIPRAGDDRMVFFDVSGLPDSLDAGSGPPAFARFSDPVYDLFVVGDFSVDQFSPESHLWDERGSIYETINEAVDRRVISRLELSAYYGATDGGGPISPDSLATEVIETCELVEFSILSPADETMTVQAISRRSENAARGITPRFVRVSFSGNSGHVLLGGTLDYFMKIDGKPYMVLRAGKYGSGGWGYSVYRLDFNRPPKRVYSDASWST